LSERVVPGNTFIYSSGQIVFLRKNPNFAQTENTNSMIKQDYLIRMIQEIVALLVNALLRRKRIRQEDWSEYDAMASQLLGLPLSQLQTVDVDELADRYTGEESGIEKMELASLYLLRLSEETEGSIVFKSKLRQDGLRLLKRVHASSNTYSLQREMLIRMLDHGE
jgi:hypothetical protein